MSGLFQQQQQQRTVNCMCVYDNLRKFKFKKIVLYYYNPIVLQLKKN